MRHRVDAELAVRHALQLVTRERAEAIEMRLDVAPPRPGEIDLEEIGQRRIGAEEVEPGRVRREQARGRSAHARSLAKIGARQARLEVLRVPAARRRRRAIVTAAPGTRSLHSGQ